MAKLAITLKLSRLSALADAAVNRAAAFLAIGLRAAEGATPTSLALSQHSAIQILPDPLPDDAARAILGEWQAWITGAALRELDESFSLFLERAFEAIILIESHGGTLSSDRRRELSKLHGDTNTRSRLEKVLSRIELPLDPVRHFSTISSVRNLLTHNAGVVRSRDCQTDNTFTITWIGMDVIVSLVEDSSELLRYSGNGPMTPLTVPKDSEVALQFVERKRAFSVGEAAHLSPHDLHEICYMFRRTAQRIVTGIAAFGIWNGVNVGSLDSKST